MYFCRYKSMRKSGRGEERDGFKMSGMREEQSISGLEIIITSQESKIIFGSYY